LAHLERVKDERSDIPPPCAFEFVHRFRCGDTSDDYEPLSLEGEDERKCYWVVTPEQD